MPNETFFGRPETPQAPKPNEAGGRAHDLGRGGGRAGHGGLAALPGRGGAEGRSVGVRLGKAVSTRGWRFGKNGEKTHGKS